MKKCGMIFVLSLSLVTSAQANESSSELTSYTLRGLSISASTATIGGLAASWYQKDQLAFSIFMTGIALNLIGLIWYSSNPDIEDPNRLDTMVTIASLSIFKLCALLFFSYQARQYLKQSYARGLGV